MCQHIVFLVASSDHRKNRLRSTFLNRLAYLNETISVWGKGEQWQPRMAFSCSFLGVEGVASALFYLLWYFVTCDTSRASVRLEVPWGYSTEMQDNLNNALLFVSSCILRFPQRSLNVIRGYLSLSTNVTPCWLILVMMVVIQLHWNPPGKAPSIIIFVPGWLSQDWPKIRGSGPEGVPLPAEGQ